MTVVAETAAHYSMTIKQNNGYNPSNKHNS